MARLDRLGPAKEVAQIGAAIGREFSHALLGSVARKPSKDADRDGASEDRGLEICRSAQSSARAGAREASCADFGVAGWDFNPKPE
jgi:hypothetical protein